MQEVPLILTETRGRVGLITLNRPQQMNALNDALMDALGAALLAFDADDGIGAIVIAGQPRAFAAGADIAAMADWGYMDVYQGEFITRNWETIRRVRKPVLAAVAGVALGGGCELALACDFRVAGESARFGQPEINLGIIPGYGGTQRLARLVGASRAKYLCFTGEQITAQEAYRIGLADAVVPDDQLQESAIALAQKLAVKAPVALGMIKRAIDDGLQKELGSGLDLEACLFGEVFGTQDRLEGVQAFREKRAPRFTGR